MEPLKREITAVVKALSEPADTPEEAAEAAIRALDEARLDRTMYGIVVNARPAPYIYREFGNKREALEWAKKQGLDVIGLAIWVVPMRSKLAVERRHTTAAHRSLMNERTGAAPSTKKPSRTGTRSSASAPTSGTPSKRRARATRGRSTKATKS